MFFNVPIHLILHAIWFFFTELWSYHFLVLTKLISYLCSFIKTQNPTCSIMSWKTLVYCWPTQPHLPHLCWPWTAPVGRSHISNLCKMHPFPCILHSKKTSQLLFRTKEISACLPISRYIFSHLWKEYVSICGMIFYRSYNDCYFSRYLLT